MNLFYSNLKTIYRLFHGGKELGSFEQLEEAYMKALAVCDNCDPVTDMEYVKYMMDTSRDSHELIVIGGCPEGKAVMMMRAFKKR